jgi:cytochrome oxidase Cu insertion factor (SCO1/SenC/PrrC family)
VFKTRQSLIALLSVLLLLLLAAAAVLWQEGGSGAARVVSTGRAAIGGPYRLVNQDGKPVSDRDFRGRYQLIYFGYTFCPDVCPTTLALIAAALEKMGPDANRIVPIFISVDPGRDTPQVIKKYLAAFDPRFVGLTGSQSELSKVEKEYKVYAQKEPLKGGTYAVSHSSVIYLMGPKGKLVTFYNEVLTPEQLAKDLSAKTA